MVNNIKTYKIFLVQKILILSLVLFPVLSLANTTSVDLSLNYSVELNNNQINTSEVVTNNISENEKYETQIQNLNNNVVNQDNQKSDSNVVNKNDNTNNLKILVDEIKNSFVINETKLNNGIKIVYRKNTSADIVVFKFVFKAGSAYETEKNNGISCLLFELIKKGNAKMNAEQIAKSIEQTGAIFKTDVSKTNGFITLVSTLKFLEQNLDIVTNCILTSNFPQNEVEKEKQFLIGALKAENDNLSKACAKLFYKTMFANHPYALHHYGDVNVISKITRNDIINWYKTIFNPNNMTIVVVGNIEFDQVKKMLEERFNKMQSQSQNNLKIFEEVDKKIVEANLKIDSVREAKEYKEKAQAFIYYGFLTSGVESKDYGALKLLATILGSGMSSRLFHNLRDKESLAYQITAYYQTLRGNSAVIALMGTQPEKYEQALSSLKREFEAFKNELVTEAEYEKAKNKLIGNYAITRNTMQDQAEYLALWEGLGLGAKFELEFLDSILKPTREDIREVACKYFDQNKLVLAVIYPKKGEDNKDKNQKNKTNK